MKLQFSGHDSFICKNLWLKKGYDFTGNFNDELAVIELGVGKNMVTAISYWLKAFGILNQENEKTHFANYLFNKRDGKDKYIENIATLWLLQYSLIKTNKASIYNIFFNQFRSKRPEFTKEHLYNLIDRMLMDQKSFTENTIKTDIAVFIRSYLRPSYKETKIDIEEDFSALLIDLNLMSSYEVENIETKKLVDWYKVPNKNQFDLPDEVVLFAILDNYEGQKSIAFNELLNGINSPGSVFCLSDEGLYEKIERIVEKNAGVITYSESAGIRQLQIKRTIDKWEVLNGCY